MRIVVRGLLVALMLTTLAVIGGPASGAEPDDDVVAPFSLKVKDIVAPLRMMSVFVLPGEQLTIEAVGPTKGARFILQAHRGALVTRAFNRWEWRAPAEPGRYRLEVDQIGTDAEINLTAFVMVPASRVLEGWLNGYRIGNYPAKPLKGNPIYLPPRGFVEVTQDNRDTRLTPRFKLQQFLSKQESKYPKYVVLRESLLLSLERLVDELNRAGIEADGLHIMSGYRTPFYNRAIGNVQYSLHQWGVAADVFVDEDSNGLMDDVNRDKKIDRGDAVTVYGILERLDREEPSLVGGLGIYAATKAHGPFVHLDIRTWRARW